MKISALSRALVILLLLLLSLLLLSYRAKLSVLLNLQACAPRYIKLDPYPKITLRWLLGRCLLLKDDLSGHLNRKWILNPCENGMNLYLFTWQVKTWGLSPAGQMDPTC